AQGPYSFIAADDQGRPGRWDPCGGPIEWYLNAALAPPGGDVVVHEAFDYLEAITGLDFAFAGPTALDPARDRVSGAVVVGWVASLDAAGRGGAAYRVRPTG